MRLADLLRDDDTTDLHISDFSWTRFSPIVLDTAPFQGSFVSALHPLTQGVTISGTAGADFIHEAGDAVSPPVGLFNEIAGTTEGDDTVGPSAGGDVIYGQGGNDTLQGGSGDDQIFGGPDDDQITDSAGGNDKLYGGDGNDVIEVRREIGGASGNNVLLDGGPGNDLLYVYRHSAVASLSATILGGDGNDTITVVSGSVIVDAGPDDDKVLIFSPTSLTITLGSGHDSIEFVSGVPQNASVTDFAAGNGGDNVDFSDWLDQNLSGWSHGNPFSDGHLRLAQSGSSSVLQFDSDGTANGASWVTLMTFGNTAPGQFTSQNFSGYDPGGAPSLGETINGTPGDDVLNGTPGPDHIYGFEGNDQITGGDGDDYLDGGDGNDAVTGGYGNDTIHGGAGNDVLDGQLGSDAVFGEDGDDEIFASDGPTISGGNGNDLIYTNNLSGTTQVISGDAGDDDLHLNTFDAGPALTVLGGDGRDYFFLTGNSAGSVDGGAGDDNFYLNNSGTGLTITLGSGSDFIIPDPSKIDSQTVEVTDFAAGPGGDVIWIRDYMQQLHINWTFGQNPFSLGYIEAVQSGSNTLIEVLSGSTWRTILQLDDTQAGTVQANNVLWDDMSKPSQFTESVTVASDQVLRGYDAAGDPTDWYLAAAADIEFTNQHQIFNNLGRILLSSRNLTLDGTPTGTETGVFVGQGGVSGLIENAGLIGMDNRAGLLPQAAEGILSDGFEQIHNAASGVIDIAGVSAAGLDVTSPVGGIVNDGLIHVFGQGEAIGLLFPKNGDFDVVNNGTISIDSPSPESAALQFGDDFGHITNTGQIVNHDTDTAAAGIVWVGAASAEVIDNSGTISAPLALFEETDTFSGGDGNATVNNSGLIQGEISLNQGADKIINTGTIDGYVSLGSGNDNFNGTGGTQTGEVHGDAGNDIIVGGSGADQLFGDDGDDTLTGGAGNDTIDGGTGNDTAIFFGSAGDYQITTHGAVKTVVGPDGTDTLVNVENIQFVQSNTQPTLGGVGGTADYTEQDAGVAIFPAVVVGDDGMGLTGAAITLGNSIAGDVLGFTDQNGIAGSYDSGTHVLALSGVSSLANYQAALRSITFSSLSDDPTAGGHTARDISVSITDASLTSTSVGMTIAVVAVDDPAILHNAAFATPESAAVGTGLDLFADNGAGAGSDPDSALAVTAVNGSAASVGHQITLASGALLTVNADGTFLYDPNHVFDYLAAPGSGAGDTQATDSFTYADGSVTATATVTVTGVDSGDWMTGTPGNDTIDGGAGTDTLVFTGSESAYSVRYDTDTQVFAISGPDGNDTARNVEKFQFADGSYTADTGGYAWAIQSTVLDDQGSIASQTFVTAVGTHWVNEYDTANNAPWLWASLSYGTDGQRMSEFLSYDDGSQELDVYDHGTYLGAVMYSPHGDIVHMSGIDPNTLDTLLWFNTPYNPDFGGAPDNLTPDGGGGIDVLHGFAGNDRLDGGGGDDVLAGGGGNDVLTGGVGNDRFIYGYADGRDIITDFTHGTDTIEIRGVANFTDLQALMSQSGADIVIALDPQNTLTLQDLQVAQVSAGDFVFM